MKNEEFHFKRFSVSHSRSSMKVGVDAVLLATWIQPCKGKFLDVGTGCGIISMIFAQRCPDADILAIDIDKESISEASGNFRRCEFAERLEAQEMEFPKDIIEAGLKFDLIVSNPPFFRAGVFNPLTPREKARHQNSLSPFSLIENATKLLEPDGSLAMIFPMEFLEEVRLSSKEFGMEIRKLCKIRNNPSKPVKRVMVDMIRLEDAGLSFQIAEEELVMFEEGRMTEKHKALVEDFYLNV